MKNIFKNLLFASSVSALIFSCTDLEEELVGDITNAVTVEAPNIGGDAGGGRND